MDVYFFGTFPDPLPYNCEDVAASSVSGQSFLLVHIGSVVIVERQAHPVLSLGVEITASGFLTHDVQGLQIRPDWRD
ncbi:hypothetical protein AALO_G00271900 [Alosa alosa]|uniref:Uncharacterized protein n=1 Tax=Alosa alosa TaxID=278164 RepID=A0AAV6FSB5_9TELE|nr:hypothetical protein AALO_G00271900 [Alosa alosa]